MIPAVRGTAGLEQIRVHPLMQFGVTIRITESRGIAMIDGRPVVNGVGKEIKITVVDTHRILVQKREGVRGSQSVTNISEFKESLVSIIDLRAELIKARIGSHVAIHRTRPYMRLAI